MKHLLIIPVLFANFAFAEISLKLHAQVKVHAEHAVSSDRLILRSLVDPTHVISAQITCSGM